MYKRQEYGGNPYYFKILLYDQDMPVSIPAKEMCIRDRSLTERSAEIEGLSDVIASFADGSKEGVNAVAGLAAATDEELREVVANYNANKQAMSDASNSTSMLVNEVPQEIDKLQKELEDGVAAIDVYKRQMLANGEEGRIQIPSLYTNGRADGADRCRQQWLPL